MTHKSSVAWIGLLFFCLAGRSAADTMSDMNHHHDMSAEPKHWSAPAKEARRRNPVPANAASIEEGKKLFQANCTSCHGPAGRGDGPAAASLDPRPADLAEMAGHHPDGDFAWKIANGRGPMPPWKSFTEKQIWSLVNYIKSLGAGEHRH
ncbi:MAG TPA: cytochrome c [Burkholderiales bacterium]|nr:cytochrome c [Burkholderiales bacterium]